MTHVEMCWGQREDRHHWSNTRGRRGHIQRETAATGHLGSGRWGRWGRDHWISIINHILSLLFSNWFLSELLLYQGDHLCLHYSPCTHTFVYTVQSMHAQFNAMDILLRKYLHSIYDVSLFSPCHRDSDCITYLSGLLGQIYRPLAW